MSSSPLMVVLHVRAILKMSVYNVTTVMMMLNLEVP